MNTFPLSHQPIVQIQHGRLLDLANYLALAVMGVLGIQQLDSPAARGVAAGLCIAFALLHGFLLPTVKDARMATVYFGLQTVVVTSLLFLRSGPDEFFGFLFYILAILAATTFPTSVASGWIALFFAISVLANSLQFDPPRLILTAFTGAVLLMCGLFGHSLRESELARRHNQALLDELARTQRRLQALTLAEERNRMAREIHDGLGHYLTATAMQVQGARAVLEGAGIAAQAPAALAALGKAETLLQEALGDVRRSVAALRTAAEDRPLPTLIGELVDSCRTPGGLEAQFVLLGRPRPLNPQAELALYRTAQEGLTNVRKHAHARHVEVTLAYTDHAVKLTIADDGQGGSAQGEAAQRGGEGVMPEGFGLIGLQERVQLLGGALHIQRAPGQGFRLKVEIPA